MIRGVGLRSAIAINVATIVGAGPLITIPLVVVAMHGSLSVWPWIAGAAIALCDGLVYAELASRFPRSGGTYAYLREAFGAHGPGRLLAFVFVWQYLFVAPLTLASGYIGFAQYAAYVFPPAALPLAEHAIALAVGIVTLLSLYRTIPHIAHTALGSGAIAVVTLLAIAACGFLHPAQHVAALLGPAFTLNGLSIVGLGAAMVFTLYDYAGYNDVCQIGDEVIAPVRTIPRAVVLSIVIVGIAYVLLNLGVFSALPLAEVAKSTFVASLAVERTAGHTAAFVVTLAILVTAFASTYGLLLGASRVPYAAARDGDFLAPFAKLHPTKRFPNVSLVALGVLALPATLFPLDTVINVLTAGIVLVQGVGGNVAVMVLRRRTEPAPFRLPLYPVPVLIALAAWLFLFWSSGTVAMLFGVATLALGAAIFLVRARLTRAWPFALAVAALARVRARAATERRGDVHPRANGHARVERARTKKIAAPSLKRRDAEHHRDRTRAPEDEQPRGERDQRGQRLERRAKRRGSVRPPQRITAMLPPTTAAPARCPAVSTLMTVSSGKSVAGSASRPSAKQRTFGNRFVGCSCANGARKSPSRAAAYGTRDAPSSSRRSTQTPSRGSRASRSTCRVPRGSLDGRRRDERRLRYFASGSAEKTPRLSAHVGDRATMRSKDDRARYRSHGRDHLVTDLATSL